MFHVVWVLCWFIASVEWAVVQNEMRSYIKTNIVQQKYLANNCTDPTYNEPGSYAQAAIADVSFICYNVCVSINAAVYFGCTALSI